jgi:hypothetical protein
MANSTRVIYGTEIDTTVDGSLTPEVILSTLRGTYKELADAEFTITSDGDGNDVMRITLKEGKKALAFA